LEKRAVKPLVRPAIPDDTVYLLNMDHPKGSTTLRNRDGERWSGHAEGGIEATVFRVSKLQWSLRLSRMVNGQWVVKDHTPVTLERNPFTLIFWVDAEWWSYVTEIFVEVHESESPVTIGRKEAT
jgi:hypothetical protein